MRRPLASIVLMLLVGVSRSQTPDFAGFEKVIAAEMAATNSPGAAVAVVKGDRILYAKGFGVRSIEAKDPVTTDTLFRLGSTTKMFTAAAVVQLAEEGKLKLDEPVGQHVKDLPKFLAGLTPHQLLSHTAGLADASPMKGPPEDAALGRFVRGWGPGYELAAPNRIFSYANPGYALAGLLAEEVDGKPFADLMKERLFKPLGMTSTCLRPTDAMTYRVAVGHDGGPLNRPRVDRPLADNAQTRPAGQMFSNVLDLAHFAIAFLNDGQLNGEAVLTPSLIKTLSTPHAELPGGKTHYGYGLMIGTLRGVKLLEHGGSRSGFGSHIRMAPEQKVAIIVLINRTAGQLPKSLEVLSELVLPLGDKSTVKPKLGEKITAAEAEKLTGKYRSLAVEVTVAHAESGALEIRGGAIGGTYLQAGAMAFTSETGRQILFVAGPDGAVEFLFAGSRALKKSGAK